MKNILLTLSVLLMAIMFMGTSFVVATDHAGLLVASGSKSNVNGVPFAQASVTSNAGYGKYNSASVRGYLLKENIGMNAYSGPTDKVIQNITVGIRPHAIAFDSSNGNVYVTNCGSDGVRRIFFIKTHEVLIYNYLFHFFFDLISLLRISIVYEAIYQRFKFLLAFLRIISTIEHGRSERSDEVVLPLLD